MSENNVNNVWQGDTFETKYKMFIWNKYSDMDRDVNHQANHDFKFIM